MTARLDQLAVGTLTVVLLLMSGCTRDGGTAADANPETDEHVEPQASNRVAIPSAVRSNLGISFVTVERRRIEQTLRVPGQFEYLPTARREYRTMLPGRVELLVQQFDVVDEGALLYRIDSPGWRAMQQQLADAESTIHVLDNEARDIRSADGSARST